MFESMSPALLTARGIHRTAFLIGFLIFPCIVTAQQMGDEIVVVEQSPLRAASRTVDTVEAGTVLRVRAVWRNQLLVSQGIPGWIDFDQTLPVSEGQTHFDAIISQEGGSLESYCARIRFLIARRELAAARDDLDRARSIAASSIEVATLTAELALAMRDWNGAIENASAVLAIKPNSAAMYFVRGRALTGLGEIHAALLSFARARELAPRSGVHQLWLACMRHQLAQPDKARQALQESLARDPWNEQSLAMRGLYFARDERYLSSVGDLNRAIALGPVDAAMYGGRAYAFHHLQEFESALHDANLAISLDPASASYLVLRGRSYFRLGKFPEALDDLSKAIELGEQNAEVFFECGFAQLQLDCPEFAVLALDAALSREPAFDQAWTTRAIAHARLGEYHAAIADFTQAIELAPDKLGNYVLRACAYLYVDESILAEADFEECRRRNQEFGELRQLVGLRDLVKLVQ